MNKLTKKLKILKSVVCNNWGVGNALRDQMDNFEVLDKTWHDEFQDKYEQLDLTDPDVWRTYDGCRSARFIFMSPKFVKCEVTVWDGDRLYGNRGRIRFSATLKIPISFLKEIKDSINCDFYRHCARMHSRLLELQKEEWIKKYTKDVL